MSETTTKEEPYCLDCCHCHAGACPFTNTCDCDHPVLVDEWSELQDARREYQRKKDEIKRRYRS